MIVGGCMCGAVRYRVPGQMLWSAYCHCTDCQRAAAADYVSWFGVTRDSVDWAGARGFFKSSLRVVRSFCETCGTPLTFETEILPGETHLYAPSLDDRSLYRPTAHVFWPERVPWLGLTDDLPKYERGMQSAALDGTGIG